ncbi:MULTISPECIES: hypothetical protein [unclassified Haladaptatus]|uniref:hypothetical protein n=1 Tax=unclassified Haladaptatus TaxID=2622732 RepID=UPI0023E8B477|nr:MULTISPECIES: hypothetical protein [unclassified Haladaptatus]
MRFVDGLRHVESESGWVAVDNLNALVIYAGDERVYALTLRLEYQHIRGCFSRSREGIRQEMYALLSRLFERTVTVE